MAGDDAYLAAFDQVRDETAIRERRVGSVMNEILERRHPRDSGRIRMAVEGRILIDDPEAMIAYLHQIVPGSCELARTPDGHHRIDVLPELFVALHLASMPQAANPANG